MQFTLAAIATLCLVSVQADVAAIYAGIADEEENPFQPDNGFSPLFPDFTYDDHARLRAPGSYPWPRERKPSHHDNNQGLQLDELQWMQDQIFQKLKQQYKLDAERNFQAKNNAFKQDFSEFGFAPPDDAITNRERLHDAPPLGYFVPKDFYDPIQESQAEPDVHGMEMDYKGTVDSGIFKNIPFIKDPTTFAYPPSDQHFYETTNSLTKAKPRDDESGTKQASLPKPINIPSNSDTRKDNINEDYAFLDAEEKGEINAKQRNDFRNDVRYRNDPRQHDGADVDVIAMKPSETEPESTRIYILAIIAGVSAAALVTLVTLVITWFNIQKHVKNASDVEYPAYGVTGPNKEISPSGDRRLAQSAQMYHYQHQKQQIIAMERAAANERHGSVSEAESEEENEEGDYTVYECPGLAPTGEMEVKNPLFHDDPTPAQTPQPNKHNNNSHQVIATNQTH